jgi:hypothetical protein
MNEFSGAVEFCPVCMRHGALADDIESGESSSDRRGKRRKRGEQKGQSWWFIDIRSRELVAAKGDPRVRIPSLTARGASKALAAQKCAAGPQGTSPHALAEAPPQSVLVLKAAPDQAAFHLRPHLAKGFLQSYKPSTARYTDQQHRHDHKRHREG